MKRIFLLPFFLQVTAMAQTPYIERDDKEWKRAAEEWLACQNELQTLKQKEAELRQTLISLSNEQNCKGGGIKLSRSTRKGAIQYAQIPELNNLDLEKYRNPSTESWRLVADNSLRINQKNP